uniref:NADH dehydrogenase [ubiquinone] 1 alpha subcomplex subunit 10, mitochondrial n=1 Tax=Moina brachiata TaxID=675436 RepID=A0A4Y7NIM1_9CRUS|nr:EOG090X05NZ [Moina brachiata]SVE92992.1 EOG090X05NZ [Moina brachiata]
MVFINCVRVSSKLYGNVVIIAAKQPQNVGIQSVVQRGISSKAMRHRLPKESKPAPFPYKEKKYTFLKALFDTTSDRLDENSKLILVEGPPAAGKGALAKEIAEDLDMHYLPSPTIAEHMVNSYGYNLKQLDSQLPETCKSYDETDFLRDPKQLNGTKAGRFQLTKFSLRYQRYIEALAHILNTGQGVVMDRSPYSDLAYIAAMAEHGIVSRNIFNYYHQVRNNSLFAIWRPHLVVYLDVPVEETRRRIEARNRPHEKDSLATTPAYLQTLENVHKKNYLKDISIHAEVLVYDGSKPVEPEIVVEDIERLNFEQYGPYDEKMKDWRSEDKWTFNNHRMTFTNDQDSLMQYLNVPGTRCPEVIIPPEDFRTFERIFHEAPGNKYARGFNEDAGDKGALFKLS